MGGWVGCSIGGEDLSKNPFRDGRLCLCCRFDHSCNLCYAEKSILRKMGMFGILCGGKTGAVVWCRGAKLRMVEVIASAREARRVVNEPTLLNIV